MLIAGMAFFLGVVAAVYAPQPEWLFVVLAFAACIIWRNGLRGFLFAVACGCAGAGYAHIHLLDYQSRLVSKPQEGVDIQLSGQVVSLPVVTGYGWRIAFQVDQESELAGQLLRLNGYHKRLGESFVPRLGQSLQMTARLKRPHGYANPAGFDYEQWLLMQGIHATGYIRSIEHYLEPAAPPLRSQLWQRFDDYQSPGASLVAALLLGHKSAIPHKERQLFVDTGTAHLFAISGLHIGMVAALAYALVKLLLLILLYLPEQQLQRFIYRLTPQSICLLMSFGAASLYASLADWSLPTQRALIMLGVVYGGLLLRQRIHWGHSLGLAVLLVLLVQPLAVLGAGFYLSFAAVIWIGLLIHYSPFQSSWAKGLWVQCLLPLCLWPLLQFWFGSAAGFGAVANLVLIPLMGLFLLPVTMLAGVIESMWPGGALWLIQIMDISYAWIEGFLKYLLGYKGLASSRFSISLWELLSFQLAIFAAICTAFSVRLSLLCCLALLVFVFWPGREVIKDGEFQATVLDVGQGLAIVVRTANHSLLYDLGGSFPSGFNTTDAVVKPYLNFLEIERIDQLIISHADADHRGSLSALENMAENVLTGEIERLSAHVGSILPLQACQAGQQWHWDGVEFTVLWPDFGRLAEVEAVSNNRSCVVRIKSASHSLLLAGDIHKDVERLLINTSAELNADTLVAPHHGSKTSSSAEFIAAVNPGQVIFSAAYRSHFRHPNKHVIARYQAQGSELFYTASCGAAFISAAGVNCYRQKHTAAWRSYR